MSQNRFSILWRDFITSGFPSSAPDFENYETVTKLILINALSLLGFFFFFVLIIFRLFTYRFSYIPIYISAVLYFPAIIIFLRKTRNIELSGALFLLFLLILLALDLPSDFLHAAKPVVLFSYPLLAFYMLGKRLGIFAAGVLFLEAAVLIMLFYAGIIRISYPAYPFLSGFLTLVVITTLVYLKKHREKKILRLMRKRIYYDPLTNLPNRALLLRHISEVDSPALLLLNIDAFKEINATYGYRAGDMILQGAAAKLLQIVPDSVRGVYRLGGDEFAVLMNKGEDVRFSRKISHVASLITRFLQHEKYGYQNEEIRIRTTIGIALSEEVGGDKLFACADLALQTAKGTNRPFLFYKKALDTKKRYEQNLKWAGVLANALDNGRVVPYYQPIVDNSTGEIKKYECLVRLIDDEGQVISPHFFLNIAKKSRLYTRITKTMLRKAAEFAKNNRVGVSINLSVEDILDPTVVIYIDKTLRERRSEHLQICFEITESEGIENFDQVSQFIKELKKWGCQVAIDDFGSGYANFDYLTHLKVDYLKIDGSLVRGITKDKNSRLIVEKIVAFTRQMGIETIAEFVESQEILSEVKRLKIDYSQGYLLGEPRPASRESTIDSISQVTSPSV